MMADSTPLARVEGKVGDLTIPRSLYDGFVVATSVVRPTSGRDSDNNIIVYWVRCQSPADASKCWMYVSRLNVWDENY